MYWQWYVFSNIIAIKCTALPDVASSSKSRAGLRTKALAIAMRCFEWQKRSKKIGRFVILRLEVLQHRPAFGPRYFRKVNKRNADLVKCQSTQHWKLVELSWISKPSPKIHSTFPDLFVVFVWERLDEIVCIRYFSSFDNLFQWCVKTIPNVISYSSWKKNRILSDQANLLPMSFQIHIP